jgi:hypothetical protein
MRNLLRLLKLFIAVLVPLFSPMFCSIQSRPEDQRRLLLIIMPQCFPGWGKSPPKV